MKAHLTMPTDVITVPCLSDNYAFVIGNTDTNMATVVDVPEAAPINAVLAAQGWTVETVLLTHHHDDHVMGLGALTGAADAVIVGAAADATIICSGHEYTQSNARFAVTIDPENTHLTSRVAAIDAARRAGRPTVPSELSLEKQTNPFLRADDPQIKAHLQMGDATDAAVFAEIRARKDKF